MDRNPFRFLFFLLLFVLSLLWLFYFILFISACADKLFKELSNSQAAKRILTLKEINMSFLPLERQVFRLDFL